MKHFQRLLSLRFLKKASLWEPKSLQPKGKESLKDSRVNFRLR
jgi:hypothetical protein